MFLRILRLVAAVLLLPGEVLAIAPADPGPGDVTFTINATAASKPISPLIYGVQGFVNFGAQTGIGGLRLGGNRWTGYNWETNASNAGTDYFNSSDNYLVGNRANTPPGEAVRPTLASAASLGAAAVVTVPIAGYVSADTAGEVLASQTAPSSRWRTIVPHKADVYPGSQLSLSPNKTDNYVFTDEFVHWVEAQRQNGQQVLYSLDNEPSLWDSTHPRIWGTTTPTFAQLAERTIANASAIKDTAPDAKVLGGVLFGWSAYKDLTGAADYNTQVPQPRDPQALDFNRWFLSTLAAEEARQGRTIVDALDLHWYPEATGGGVRITFDGTTNNSAAVVAARLQAPRSLWDPTYVETSWITQYSTNHQAIRLLDRVQSDIDELKPGTKISISEYNYGGGNHISGGIAQADVLGIFGREGVYNASWWPIESADQQAFVEGAFRMFRNFDGQGDQFGDLSIVAQTTDNAESSVYASRSSDDPNTLVLVAINKTGAPLDAAVQLTGDLRYTQADVFRLTAASSTPVGAGSFAINLLNAFHYTMPAYSVSTIRLTAAGVAGDFNGDGAVDAADYTVWRDTLASTTDLRADANSDGVVDAVDYGLWRQAYGAASSAIATPEPAACCLVASALALQYCARRRR